MDKRRLRKHRADKRALSVVRKHRSYFVAVGAAPAYDRAERLVLDEAAQFRAQEACRMKRYAATACGNQTRTSMHVGIRHVCTVAGLPAIGMTFKTSRLTNDVQRIAHWDAVLSATAPHAKRLEAAGIQPGFLDRLAGELATFKAAKAAIIQAGQQYTEATAALDQTFTAAGNAITILEGILATSKDAPAGVVDSLRRARFIGPRARTADQAVPVASTTPTIPAIPSGPEAPRDPVVNIDGRRRWVPRILPRFSALAPEPQQDTLAKAG